MALGQELEGILVVSIEQAVAAPYCGLLLADAGARVIKVERPEGDFARGYDRGAGGQSSYFAWLNRGKESICLDFDRLEDQELLSTMLEKADVLLSNLAPGALARRGFSGERLRENNRGLITCDISGYGSEGAGAGKKAYDFLVQAESGVCSVTGTADDPVRVGISVADIASGLTAFSAILRAIIQRGRKGVGTDISISMFDVLADWMNMPLMGHRYMNAPPKRMGLAHSAIAPYGAYRTADGEQVLIAIQNNREWCWFCEQVLEKPGLAEDPRFCANPERHANRESLDGEINQVFQNLSSDELIAILDKARIANARVNSVADVSNHDLLRNQVARFGDSVIEVADLPVATGKERPERVPLLDQHGDAIRREFGNQGGR